MRLVGFSINRVLPRELIHLEIDKEQYTCQRDEMYTLSPYNGGRKNLFIADTHPFPRMLAPEELPVYRIKSHISTDSVGVPFYTLSAKQ